MLFTPQMVTTARTGLGQSQWQEFHPALPLRGRLYVPLKVGTCLLGALLYFKDLDQRLAQGSPQ